MNTDLARYLSFSLLTMPAFVLTIRHGAGISAISIFVLSVIVLISHYPIDISLNKKEKLFIFSLLLLPMVIACDVIIRELNFRYLDYYLRFILVIPVFFALRTVKVYLNYLVIGILIGAIGTGLFALYQKLFLQLHDVHGYVLQISFGNISLLLGMMSLAGFFLVNNIPYKKTFNLFTILAFIMGVTGSLISGTRGGWIAIPFFISLFLIYLPVRRDYKIIASIMFILALVLTYYTNNYIQTRVDSVYQNAQAYYNSDSDESITSTGRRLVEWKAGWLMFRSSPIVGIGSGQYEQVLQKQIEAGKVKKIELVGHAHNEILQLLAITGIIGFTAYMFLYIGITHFFYSTLSTSQNQNIKYLSFLGIMIVGAYFIFGLTNYSFGHHVMVTFFSVMIATLAGMISYTENKLTNEPIYQ